MPKVVCLLAWLPKNMGSSISQNILNTNNNNSKVVVVEEEKSIKIMKRNNNNKTIDDDEEDGEKEKFYSRAEVSKHSTNDSIWIIFNDKVCDMTDYLDFHPGGNALLKYAGKDATFAIRMQESHAFSHSFIKNKIDECCIGKIND